MCVRPLDSVCKISQLPLAEIWSLRAVDQSSSADILLEIWSLRACNDPAAGTHVLSISSARQTSHLRLCAQRGLLMPGAHSRLMALLCLPPCKQRLTSDQFYAVPTQKKEEFVFTCRTCIVLCLHSYRIYSLEYPIHIFTFCSQPAKNKQGD